MATFNQSEEMVKILVELRNYNNLTNPNQVLGKYDHIDKRPLNKELFKNLFTSYRILKRKRGHNYAVNCIAHFSTKDAVIVDYLFR